MTATLPILMYHDIASHPLKGFEHYTVATESFAAQMRFLSWAGYTTMSLGQLADRLTGGGDIPPRAVILTFDDGFRSCIENAVPQLERFGFTATFFIVAGLVGGGSRWLRDSVGAELPLADWKQLRRLVEHGFECGSHTLSHPHLPALSTEECRHELAASKARMEERLGRAVLHLAYPYGEYTAESRTLARETGYRTVCAVRGGLSGKGDDLFGLRRVAVNGGDSIVDFAWRVRTAQFPRPYLLGKARGAWARMRRLGRVPA